MITAEDKVIRALLTPDGKIIAEFLNKCSQEKVQESLVALDNIPMYRAQGAAIELKEIVTLANKAHTLIK